MPLFVLSVGQCGFDDSRLARLLHDHCQAVLESADSAPHARRMLAEKPYALLLANRIFDADGDSGASLIGTLRASGSTIPMMLVSDYPDAQQAAIAQGALPGFGKSQLNSPATAALLRTVLTAPNPTG